MCLAGWIRWSAGQITANHVPSPVYPTIFHPILSHHIPSYQCPTRHAFGFHQLPENNLPNPPLRKKRADLRIKEEILCRIPRVFLQRSVNEVIHHHTCAELIQIHLEITFFDVPFWEHLQEIMQFTLRQGWKVTNFVHMMFPTKKELHFPLATMMTGRATARNLGIPITGFNHSWDRWNPFFYRWWISITGFSPPTNGHQIGGHHEDEFSLELGIAPLTTPRTEKLTAEVGKNIATSICCLHRFYNRQVIYTYSPVIMRMANSQLFSG